MSLILKERLWQGGTPYGQVERKEVDWDLEIRGNEKLQSNSKINTVIKLQLSSPAFSPSILASIVSCASAMTDVPVAAVWMDSVFDLCVWSVKMQSTLNQVVLGHSVIIFFEKNQ